MDRTEIRARLECEKSKLEKLRSAYLALLDGGVKEYRLDDRSLTKFDIDKLAKEIDAAEKKVDELTALLNGGGRRKAVGVIPRDW